MRNTIAALILGLIIAGPARTQPCTTGHRPLVLIHGFLGSGDNFGPMVQHLAAQGYCASLCFVYDWNSVARSPQAESLDRLIDSVLRLTGAKQVDLAGHSAGGGVGFIYLADSSRAAKVAHYIHIGSGASKQTAAPQVPMLNLYSLGDKVVKGAPIPGALNLAFTHYDHFELVTADSTAHAIYNFITGKKPVVATRGHKHKKPSGTFSAGGRVVSLGENTVQAGAGLRWWQGKNAVTDWENKPAKNTLTLPNGRFTLHGVAPEQPLLIEVKPASGKLLYYYFPKIDRGDSLMYLRTLPATGMVSLLMATLPAQANQAVLVVFSRQKAVIAGRDSLAVNGLPLSTPAWADAAKTAIAWFLFDGNKNGQTDAGLLPQFGSVPFMRGIDVALTPGNRQASIYFNGATHEVPLVPASKGITLVVL